LQITHVIVASGGNQDPKADPAFDHALYRVHTEHEPLGTVAHEIDSPA
jgi:hypothetical protein